MKIIVTGGAGFIGSNIVDALIENEHDVIVIDNESADSNDFFYWNQKCSNYKLDICDYKSIYPLFKDVDIVFHVAAEARIQPSILNPLKSLETNIIGTYNILQASRLNNVKRVIYSSTSSAYGRNNKTPFTEDMKKDCLTAYSISKTCGEELCKMYYQLYNLETVSLRYFNVYGERQPTKGQYATVIGLFLKQYKQNTEMTVVGDGLQKRDYTNIKDIVKANLLAAFSDNKNILGEILNIGTGKNYTILDLVKMIGGKYKFIPPRLGESRETLADISKANKMLGWKAQIDLEDWINANK